MDQKTVSDYFNDGGYDIVFIGDVNDLSRFVDRLAVVLANMKRNYPHAVVELTDEGLRIFPTEKVWDVPGYTTE